MNNVEVGEIYIPSKTCVEWIVSKSTLASILPGFDGQCIKSPFFTYCNRSVQMRFMCRIPMNGLPGQHTPYFQLDTPPDITFQAPTAGYSSFGRRTGILPRFQTTSTMDSAIIRRGIRGTDGSYDVVFNDVDRLFSALDLAMSMDNTVQGFITLVELVAILIKDKDVTFFINCGDETVLEYNSPVPVKKAKISTTCNSTHHDEYETESHPTCGASRCSISSPRPHKARSRQTHQAYQDSVDPPSLQDPEISAEIDPSDEFVNTTRLLQVPPRERETFFKNLEESFIKQEYCDITIQVEDQLLRSHKLILSARSPVLKAMMVEDMLEQNCGMVKVTDCNPKIFQKFLLYLYSGKVEDISVETVIELYKTADKYKVDDLKTICINYMKTNLSVGLFTNIIKLASVHNEAELLKAAKDYFMINAKIILSHPSWELFTKENFAVAQELCLLAL